MEVDDAMVPEPTLPGNSSQHATRSRGETEPRDELETSPQLSGESSPREDSSLLPEESSPREDSSTLPQESSSREDSSLLPQESSSGAPEVTQSHGPKVSQPFQGLSIPDLINSDEVTETDSSRLKGPNLSCDDAMPTEVPKDTNLSIKPDISIFAKKSCVDFSDSQSQRVQVIQGLTPGVQPNLLNPEVQSQGLTHVLNSEVQSQDLPSPGTTSTTSTSDLSDQPGVQNTNPPATPLSSISTMPISTNSTPSQLVAGAPTSQMLSTHLGGASPMHIGNFGGVAGGQMLVGSMGGTGSGQQLLTGSGQQLLMGSVGATATAGHMLMRNIGGVPTGQMLVGNVGGSLGNQMIVGNMSGTPVNQMIVGNMTGAQSGQLLLSGSSGQLMMGSQLPVVIPSTSTPLSQGMQLPLVVGRPTPVSSQMLLHLPQSMLHLKQLNTVAGGPTGKIMKIGAPLQLIPTTSCVSSPGLSTTSKLVTIGQPVKTSLLGPPSRFVNATKIAKTSIQILPTQQQANVGPRKSIVLKNPGSSQAGFVTISSDQVKPFTGKIVGKVPPGMLRFANPALNPTHKTNQVYLTKGNHIYPGDSPGATQSPDGHGPNHTTASDPQEEVGAGQGFEEPVSRRLDLDAGEEAGDLSLECNEEFDDSFEKKEKEESARNEVGGEKEAPGEGTSLQDETVDEAEEEEDCVPMEEDEDEDEESPDQDEDPPDQEDDEDENVAVPDRQTGGIETLDLLKPLKGHVSGTGNVKVKTNEFGMMEVEDLGLGLVPVQKSEDMSKSNIIQSPRKESNARRIQDDEILYCEGCGCYGMAGEFVAQNSCSNTCNNVIQSRCFEKQRRERELQLLRMRRDERKLSQLKVKRKGLSATATEEEISNWKSSQYNQGYSWQDAKKGFIWSKYLEDCGVRSAPVRLFPGEPFPDPHGFREGMKLESIDPLHQSLLCVVTVAEVLGPRLRLHFDGYGDSHDFWENADSENLFPSGWTQLNNQKLTPPKGYGRTEFDWETYLRQTACIAAPDNIFAGRARASVGADSAVHGWKIGMKVEACDRQNKSLVCVATVGNVLEGRVLLHFDGWEIDYDYWTKPSSHNVKPVGWCSANKKQLNPPKGNHPSAFSWADYLLLTKSKPVPAWAFRSPGSVVDESDFAEGMRLEAVDVYNPRLVRVVSVAAVEGRQVEIHYDGWPDEMNHWRDDDDPNLHPCGWAAKTGHPLMAPLTPQEIKHWGERGGCETPGCRGIGHIKGSKYTSHHSVTACPYSHQNLDVNSLIPDRLQGIERERGEENRLHLIQQSNGEVLGRGNRRRKKRRFFDEENAQSNSKKRVTEDEDAGEENLREGSSSPEEDQRPKSRVSSRNNSTESLPSILKLEVKDEPLIKEEPVDLLPPAGLLSGVSVSCQTSPRTSPPPFTTEWEEGVRRSVWQPGYLPQPEPPGTLSANWAEHSKILLGGRTNSPALTFNKAKHWSTNEVVEFLNGIPNLEYALVEELIRQEEIDGESLLMLTQNDITALLGVKLGPAIKIYNAIMAVRMRRE